MDYSHYMYLRKEIDLEKMMSREDARSSVLRFTSEICQKGILCDKYLLLRGMMVTSGCVTIIKDDTNLIGISIGGGAPMCPCLYIVQVLTSHFWLHQKLKKSQFVSVCNEVL